MQTGILRYSNQNNETSQVGEPAENESREDGGFFMKNGRSILFIDNHPSFAQTLQKFFSSKGYEIAFAADGNEALEMLSNKKYDLVISDIWTPRLDGVRLMRELTARKIDAPVIFLTASGDVESYLDVMNMGAFEYLNRPLDSGKLLDVVGRALNSGD